MGAEPAVMVIDDDDHLREAMSVLLETHGYDVNRCVDAREAMDRLQQGAAPDVIVMDLIMPRMDGWQFRIELKREARWAKIPVVALSGDTSAQARAIDAHVYLSKPVDDVVLLQAVERLVHALASARFQERVSASSHQALLGVVAEAVDAPLSFVLESMERAQQTARAIAPSSEQLTLLSELRRFLARGRRGAERIRALMRAGAPPPSPARPLAPAVRQPSTRPRSRRARVCVIDDEPMMCELIGALLTGEYEVSAFTDPQAALQALRTRSFEVVLCDVMMPGLTGMDLFERLSEERPQLAQRFVFISGGGFTDATREFLATTRRPRVKKPFHRQELLDAVAAQLLANRN